MKICKTFLNILKLPFILLYFFSHLILLLIVVINYPFAKLKYKLKPNLLNRPFVSNTKLLGKGAYVIDRIFSKII